jgi:hypothetical protein
VVVARTGNVPEATAHGKLVEQFAATRPEHAAHLATTGAATTTTTSREPESKPTASTSAATASTTTATATTKQVTPSHADPIQMLKRVKQNMKKKCGNYIISKK